MDAAPAGTVISGTIAVEHPAGDPGKVKIAAAPAATAPSQFRLDAALAEVRSVRAKAVADGQAKRLRDLQPKLPPAAFQAVSQRMTARAAGMPAVASRGGAATSTSQSASTGGGAAPVGSNQPATVAQAPVIASLDLSSGSPGQQVLVSGSGFGPTPGGEVHFMVAAGKDLLGMVTYWSDAQITVEVPSIVGVRAFAGQVYVRRGTTNSRLVPFGFEPEMDYAIIPISADHQVDGEFTSERIYGVSVRRFGSSIPSFSRGQSCFSRSSDSTSARSCNRPVCFERIRVSRSA
jgi:hypothetical protein